MEYADIKKKKENKKKKETKKKKEKKPFYASFEPRTFTSIHINPKHHKKDKPYRRKFFRDWVTHRTTRSFSPSNNVPPKLT